MTYDPRLYGARCFECPYGPSRTDREWHPVPSQVIPGAPAFVAERPAKTEVEEDMNLAGPAGRVMERALGRIHVERESLTIINIVACASPSDSLEKDLHRLKRENKRRAARGETPRPSPVECCFPRLLFDLQDAKFVFTSGRIPTETLLGEDVKVSEYRGTYVEWTHPTTGATKRVYPVHHVGQLLPGRAPKWTKVFYEDVGKAFRIESGGARWVDPEMILDPKPGVLANWLAVRKGKLITHDWESTLEDQLVARHRCLGLGDADANSAIVIPWEAVEPERAPLGRDYFYTRAEQEQLDHILRTFMVREEWVKGGQNSGYFDDTLTLRALGVRPDPHIDGVLVHRLVDSELPHTLAFQGSYYTDVGAWKAKHTATKARTTLELEIYCAVDTIVNGKVLPIIWKQMHLRDQQQLYVLDRKVQEACRRMHEQGMFVDESVRVEMEREYTEKIERLRWNVVSAAHSFGMSADFNPNSTRQVADLLFDRLGLDPVTETKLGDPSTEDEALRELMLGSIDPRVRGFIGNLRLLRKAVKFKSTNIRRASEYGKDGLWIMADGRVHSTWSSHTAKCVTPDTWIFTGAGPRRIGDFQGSSVHDGHTLQRVTERIDSGRQDVQRLTLTLGYEIKAPGHHLVLVAPRGAKFLRLGARDAHGHREQIPVAPQAEWRALDQIQVGDRVLVKAGLNAWSRTVPPLTVRHTVTLGLNARPIRLPQKVTKALALFAGIYNADGSLHDANGTFSIRISTERPGRRRLVAALMKKLFGRVCVGKKSVSISSPALATWVEDVAFRRRIENKRAPAWLLACPLAFVRTYLRGLAFDSHCERNGPSPVWKYCGTEELAREVQMLLLNMGVPAAVRRAAPLPYKAWSCEVTGVSDVARVCAITGQHVPAEASRREQESRKFIRRGGDLWLRVKSNVPLGRLPTLDLTVDVTHRFVTNGLVSHNSGRSSSSDPALQNINQKLRRMYRAQDGRVLVGCDKDALELRYVSCHAHDPIFEPAFLKGDDVHALTAALIYGERFTRLQKGDPDWESMRAFAKRINFALIYLATLPTVHETICSAEDDDGNFVYPDMPLRVTRMAFRKFWDAHPAIKDNGQRWIQEFRETHFIREAVLGRRCDFLDGENPSDIVNFPVQSGGRSLVLLAMAEFVERVPFGYAGHGTGLVHDGHDALMAEVPEEDAERVATIMLECMTQKVPWTVVPFTASCKIGKNWGAWHPNGSCRSDGAPCGHHPNPDGMKKWKPSVRIEPREARLAA